MGATRTMDVPFELPFLLDTGASPEAAGILLPTDILPEPSDTFDFDDLYTACRAKICALKDAGAGFLLLSRQTSLAAMRAAMLASRGKKLPVLACLSAWRDAEDGGFLPALITLQAMGAAAVGICGAPDEAMLSAVRQAMPHASVPLAVVADAQPGQTPADYTEAVRPLLKAGVRLVVSGKNTAPEHSDALRGLLKKYGPPEIPEEPDCYAAATESEAFFLGDDITFSKPLRCTSVLEDGLIALDYEQVSAALVSVESVDDAVLLGQSGPMAKLPVGVRADSAAVLEAALRYFQGRLIVDSGSPVEREVLEPLAAKYGAIIY